MSKSSYVGQGNKLKVTNTVRARYPPDGLWKQASLIRLSQVDPDIVGGLVVEIGDRTIDLSVSSKLAKMNKLLAEAL